MDTMTRLKQFLEASPAEEAGLTALDFLCRKIDELRAALPPPTLRAAPPPETENRCPTCQSPAPHLHPALQHEGEVERCKDAFHRS